MTLYTKRSNNEPVIDSLDAANLSHIDREDVRKFARELWARGECLDMPQDELQREIVSDANSLDEARKFGQRLRDKGIFDARHPGKHKFGKVK